MKIVELHIYPIKSCAGTQLTEATVTPRGLQHDRRYMVVDAAGLFMTQRHYPAMALIKPVITPNGLSISAPNMPTIQVAAPTGATVPVDVWKSSLELPVADAAINAWFSEYLQQPCRLVYLPDDRQRLITSNRAQPGDDVSLADGFPLTIATTASLADLNTRLPAPLPMNRFRPNLVVDTTVPWDEDIWHMVSLGTVHFELPKPCPRCNMTQVEQTTGEEDGKEPIRTLRKFRFSQTEGGVLFAINAIPRSVGQLNVGDTVEVLSRQAPPELLLRA